MATATRFPHLTKRRRIYFARLAVPKAEQPIIGRKVFIASTHESDGKRANAVAAPWIAEWQARIEAARQARTDPLKAEVERLTADYRRYRNAALDEAGMALVMDVLDFVFERLGGFTPDQRRQALMDARGDVAQAMRGLPDPARAAATLDAITGRATVFLAHFVAWQAATHLTGKTLAQAESAIQKFSQAVPQPIELLQGGHVQKWIEGLLRPKTGAPIKPATVTSYLSGLRSYWSWLQSHQLIKEDHRPFWGRTVNGRRSNAEEAENTRQRFAPSDVVRLWQAAEVQGDAMLAAAIKIAAYLGARREGICTLRPSSIRRDPDTGITYVHVAEKNTAGVRDAPIHSAICILLTQLAANPDADGFLIHSSHANKYRKRGDAIGKRFTRLKTDMGFDHRYTFHSIRHTFAFLLKNSGCLLGIRKDIMGHHNTDLTDGLYPGVAILEHRRDWIERAIRYPS